MILFLDDDVNRACLASQRMNDEERGKTHWCQTAEETIQTLDQYGDEIEIVSLDHDLGGTQYQDSRAENCGMEVVRWLEKQSSRFQDTKFIVHSWNIPAGRRMASRLAQAGYCVVHRPFGS